MRKLKDDITGNRFVRLVVTGWVQAPPPKYRLWICKCDCGQTIEVKGANLKNGNTRSCGCLKRDSTVKRNKAIATRDGLTHTPTGSSWGAMMARCFNENYHDYKDYGAKGISVCEFIKTSPKSLISLIGERPRGTSLDRENNKGGYWCGDCKECRWKSFAKNVRWATQAQQNRNQKTNHSVTINGVTKCVIEWAETIGIEESSFRYRVARGWNDEQLLSPRSTRMRRAA